MKAFLDLLASERGLIGLVLIVCCTVLAALGHITFIQWQDYTWKIFVAYGTMKTATGIAQIVKGGTADPETPATETPAKV